MIRASKPIDISSAGRGTRDQIEQGIEKRAGSLSYAMRAGRAGAKGERKEQAEGKLVARNAYRLAIGLPPVTK